MKASLWIAAAAAFALAGCQKTETHEKTPTPVRVQPVTLMATSSETRYSANITPDTQVAASFRVGGYVEKLLQVQAGDRPRDIGEGDIVARGTVLAQLRQSDFAIKVNQAAAQEAQTRDAWLAAKAQLAEAEASAEQARLDFGRASRLFSSRSATKSDLDAAKARNDGSAAKVDAARNQVRVGEAQRASALESAKDAQLAQVDSALKAPLDGVILKKMIESGSLVGPGAVGFVLADTRYVKAVFGVPDTAVGELKIGQSLPVDTEAVPGQTFRSRITRISPAADSKSRVFDVEASVENRGGQLKPGMIATVAITRAEAAKESMVLPLGSVVRSKNGADRYAVFVVEEAAGKAVARMRDVRLGPTAGNGVIVAEGLKVGQKVITTGSSLVSDGEAVLLVP